MAPELQQRARQLFDQALKCPEAERKAFVDHATAGDAPLREGVEHLLRTHGGGDPSLEATVQDTGQIGRYLIRGELGRGAMGVVYDAVDPMIGRRVAVKVISLNATTEPSRAEFMKERLFREARSAGRLFHPGIVVILDVGLHGDAAFITMEHIDGRSLHQLLAYGGPLAPELAISILKQTAAALDYAHQFGVVHRDIKPANIMLQGDVTVKVADFGVAKLMSAPNQTMTGVLMGTPSYMSPEQVEAQPVDGRSDQFSLAVLAYELLTGVRPFVGESMATVAHLIVYGPRPSARAVNAALSPGADQVLERALSRFPGKRFPNCTEFALALEKALQNAKQLPPAKIEKRRGAKIFLYAGAFAVLVIAAVLFAMARFKKPLPQPPPAPQRAALAPPAPPKPAPAKIELESASQVRLVHRPASENRRQVGDVGLHRKCVNPFSTERLDQIERIDVAAVKMNAYRGCSIEPGRQGESLTESQILSGAGYQDALARDALLKILLEAKSVGSNCKSHQIVTPG